MAWDSWIPKKYHIKNELCAFEACFADNGLHYYFTSLLNKGGKIQISFCQTSFTVFNLPQAITKNKIPVLMIMNGQGVVFKKVNKGEVDLNNTEVIIQQTFPTLNIEDFFIQIYRQDEKSLFIALCRKEQAEKLLKELKQNKVELVALYIGAPAILGLAPLWNNFNKIETSLYQIELTNTKIDSIQQTKDANTNATMVFEGISVKPNHSLGFAVGLNYFMQRNIVENTDSELKQIEKKHIEKNKLRFISVVLVSIAFIAAVINMLFYTHYFDRNNQLETEIGVFQGKYDKLNQLLTKYQKNKSLIENAGVLNKNTLSEFADKLASTVPQEVSLNELNINPKNENEMSEDSLVNFKTKQIFIRGNCSKSFIVNEWLNVLKMQSFIKKVNLEKFIYSTEGALPNFEIKLITE